MKGFLTVFSIMLLFMGMMAVSSALASSEQIIMEYSFDRPSIGTVTMGGEIFDRITMPGTPNGGNTGQPALPACGAQILLPYGAGVESIEIIPGERVSLGDGYFIEPVGRPVRLKSEPAVGESPTPDETIYSSDNAFPGVEFKEIGTQGFRGYKILVLKLQPVQYKPSSGELYYYPDLTVIVNTNELKQTVSLFRGFEVDETEVLSKVDNPEMVDSYLTAPKNGMKSYDLLIITTSSLASSFQPLKDYHDANGILTEIHTTTDVGSSDPDDIRDYIRDRYLNDGIEYVIIGADDDIIPAKNLYVQSEVGSSPYYTEYNMPADVFFGCLDGTYNYDGDSYWGEPNDGEGGGDVDLIAEVFIGRAAVGIAAEADHFVNKTIEYVTSSLPYLQKVQLVGEHLGFGGPSEYAAETLDELIDGADTHGYTTVGIPSDIYSFDRLYDRDWPGNDWPRSELVSRINNSVHIIDHLGHGSEDYAMKIYDYHILNELSNDDPCLVYSQTCLAGHLDGTDCWAEYMNIKVEHGAFAVIMNARYGFGAYNSTDGPSQRFNREFWDAVFNPAEGKAELGRANHDSKEDNLYRINENCMRWCYYELNLFGDPAVSIKGVQSIAFDFPGGIPETVFPDQPTIVEVIVSGVGDGVPVPGTGQLHYSINGGPVQTEWMTEIFTNEYEATLPSVSCDDILEFYFSAEEVVNGRINDTDPGTPHQPIVATSTATIFEDDFETDQGWTISGGSWARGVPTGGGGQYGGPDPTSGYDGPNVFGYNLNGDYTNSMPERHLTSPAIDCSGLFGAHLSFWRWLGVEQPLYDHAYIRISTNGSTWITIWENGGTITDNSWSEFSYDISEYADDQPTVYIRFTMGTTDGGWTYCGWNIDGLKIVGYECDTDAPNITTASVPDWTINQPYSQQLEAVGGIGSLTWTDLYNDLAGTGLNFSSAGLLSGTPTTSELISFTAQVIDEELQTDQQLFNFTINPALTITTGSLPDWTVNVAYSQQLTSSGGTGTKNWSDKNIDLVGTGLVLSSSGLLAGTPTSEGPISFTAQVSDQASDQDEQPLSFTINPAISIITESLPDGSKDAPYSEQLAATGGTGSQGWSDKNNDLNGTGLSLSASGLLSGTVGSPGPISFTALVNDVVGSTDEKLFSFTIIEQLAILTEELPNWTAEYEYSQQLEAVGGVGILSWTDKNSDLDGTGLGLSTTGLLSGIPSTAGPITFTAVVTDEAKESTEHEYNFTINAALEITTASLPEWTRGVVYSQQLTCTGGTGTITWVDKNGDLAMSGLFLSNSGLLSGTSPIPRTITFIAQTSDQIGAADEQQYSIIFNPDVTVTTSTIPEATIDAPYSCQLESSGGTGVHSWADKNNDLDGTGLSISVTGLLSGIPTSIGDIDFTAEATDEVGGKGEKAFTLTVSNSIMITTEDLIDWTVNCEYSQQLTSAGGTGAITWTDKNSDLAGTGLSLSTSGLLSGTPTSAGEISFTAQITDEGSGIDEKPFSFMINAALVITTTTVPDWTIDRPYSQTLEVTGGTGTKTWVDLSNDLEGTGLTLDASGILSGTPLTAGPISFTARVSDQGNDIEDRLFEFTINAAVSITTVSLPEATVEQAYSFQLESSGGTGTIAWNDLNNDLNGTGLALSAGGLVSGTPLNDGVIEFTAEATDQTGSSDNSLFSITVNPAYICGDVNDDGNIDVLDITHLIQFKYKGGPEPVEMEAADVNNDGNVDVLDITYLIQFKYKGGPDPDCGS